MERHHVARQDGPTEFLMRTTHRLLHEGEIDAVRTIMRQDGLSGNPNGWTAKESK